MQVEELADGVVGRTDGLGAFLAPDADTDMRFHDHGHIVGTVANRKRDPRPVRFTHRYNICLLFWTDTTADDRTSQYAKLKERFHSVRVFHDPYKCGSVNNDAQTILKSTLRMLFLGCLCSIILPNYNIVRYKHFMYRLSKLLFIFR